jgi:hypothetical protein
MIVRRYIMTRMYPEWVLARSEGDLLVPIDLSEEEYADYRQTMDRWVAWQKRLSEAAGGL